MIGGSGMRYTPTHIQLMRKLIQLGGDIRVNTIVNKYSDTALILAVCYNLVLNIPMIDFLLENGADVNLCRYNGETQLDLCSSDAAKQRISGAVVNFSSMQKNCRL